MPNAGLPRRSPPAKSAGFQRGNGFPARQVLGRPAGIPQNIQLALAQAEAAVALPARLTKKDSKPDDSGVLTRTGRTGDWSSPETPSEESASGPSEAEDPRDLTSRKSDHPSNVVAADGDDAPTPEAFAVAEGESLVTPSWAAAPGDEIVVGEDSYFEVEDLTLTAGSSLVVRRGVAVIGSLQMEDGAMMQVIDGDLILQTPDDSGFHQIHGSFTFFNSLGSIHIHGNTTFAGSTMGLISDVHVDPGLTLIVLGGLVLDGCRITSTGTFSLLVNSGATLEMTRCDVKGAAISLVGSDVRLRNNTFTSSSVTVFSTVSGAEIFHNVFNGGLGPLNILPGAFVTTVKEGWGNVANPASVQNSLSLAFRAPVDPTRTLDSAGTLYVQPGDLVDVGLDIANLNATTQAVETLIGFSTDYLTVDSLLPSAQWSNGLYQVSDESGLVGRVNTAVGLGFSLADPDGTTENGTVADIRMEAKPLDGRTRVFFRTKDGSDHALIDTRLTASSAGVPYFKELPFMRNSPDLVIDGTPPEFAPGASAVQIQDSLPVDVLADGVPTRIGVVTVTFDVVDHLAGIDEDDVSAELVGASATLVGVPLGTSTVVLGGVTYTRHVFEFDLTNTTPDGIYEVNAIAMDRSGNTAVLPVGEIELLKNRIAVVVATQGLVSAPLTRQVVFTATDSSGAVLATWPVAVSFTGGSGSTVLDGVPDGTAFLSAKTAWNLRIRQAAALDAEGWGNVSFTGSRVLPGGDFNGDNMVTLVDYNILRSVFPGVASAPDITGEGFVNLTDYNILRANWLTVGEPQ